MFVLALLTVVVALGAAVAPRLVGFEGLAITSGSMGKAAPVGSLVLTRWRLGSEVRAGDVIAIKRPGHPVVVHRVMTVDTSSGRPTVETRGDANASSDPEPYPLPDRVPVMEHAIPLIGYLVAALRVPLGWLLLLALPATAVAAATIRDLWRRGPQQDPETTESFTDLTQAREANREAVYLRGRIAVAEEPAVVSPEEELGTYLLFVAGASGYELVERTGGVPRAGEQIDADGRDFVVSRTGASPLPGDQRRCAFVFPA